MTILARLSLGLASLAFPLTAFAAAPDNVTGIKASLANGKVTVTWNPVAGQEIANYRVFYSQASILKEGGLYDDFDYADGTANSYTFPITPSVDTLYVSVLAVNKQGEESPYFAEEASVALRGAVSSAAASSVASVTSSKAASSAAVSTAPSSTLKLLKAEKASSTGVLLTFSDALLPLTGSANTIFSLEYGSGLTLDIAKASVSGSTILLTTKQQATGTTYLLKVIGPVSGMNAAGNMVSLDPQQTPVFVQEKASSSSVAALGDHPDVTNLRLRATDEGSRRYTVDASWNAPDAAGVDGFIIAQSTDGGRTFGPSLRVSGTSRGVSIPHVAAANMGVSIRTAYKDGQVSKGIFQSMTLANGQVTSSAASRSTVRPPVGSVTGQNGNPSSLPESGVNIWALLMLTGAVVAWKRMRLQKAEA